MATTEEWRTEADDAWLATHRSQRMVWLNRKMSRLGVLGDAVSHAELGPFGGAPRKPALKLGGRAYSVVRQVTHRMSHTRIQVDLQRCARCGGSLAELHTIMRNASDGFTLMLGSLLMCRRCNGDAWLFRCRMPRTERSRVAERRVVL